MKSSRRLAADFTSIGLSQGIAAVGQVVGIRILTETLSPAVFGEVSLMLGLAALAATALCNPAMQALLRFWPEYAQSADLSLLKRVALKRILKMSTLALPLSLPLFAFGIMKGWFGGVDVLLLVALVFIDGSRLLQTTIMNASRRHHMYGAWQVGEAWGRPLAAYAAVTLWGIGTATVLISFLAASAILYLVMVRLNSGSIRFTVDNQAKVDDLFQKFATYSRPLIPLGLIAWTSGMGDRYMIGCLLSAKAVGLYVAAYGLASRPMLMLSSVTELVIRPVYYHALGCGDAAGSKKFLALWFVVVGAIGGLSWGLFALCHKEIAFLLLGPQFREASHLMPWIAAGYGILALAQIPSRVCYAHDATRAVLICETVTAIISVAVGFPLIYFYGLPGGAVAVPVYFGAQLFLSTIFAVSIARRNANAAGKSLNDEGVASLCMTLK